MSTHTIGFYEEMAKIIFHLSSNTHFICSSEKTPFRFETFTLMHPKDAN